MFKITARGFSLKEGTKSGVDKELKRVEKMLPETSSFDVTISKNVDGYKCDITVKDAGSFIRGEAIADDIESSIDFAVDDLKRKIRELKTYMLDKKRRTGLFHIAESFEKFEEEDPSAKGLSKDIVRRKNVVLNMMNDEEAIVQMEMLGHSFFVYLGEDGDVKVLYKRKNKYGLLNCER
jgi:putative sigma-54 modulation protein